jgi:hypothetical protein
MTMRQGRSGKEAKAKAMVDWGSATAVMAAIIFGLVRPLLASLIHLKLFIKIEIAAIETAGARPTPDFNIFGFRSLADYIPYDGKSCEPCKFVSRSRTPDSTQNDVVIASMLGMTYNIVPFVRSLRTTGSLCRIVFLVDDTARTKVGANLSVFLKNCGCTLIPIGMLNMELNDLYLLRNRLLYSFLDARPFLFDRIVVADLYDSIFQGDPFYNAFDRHSIGFCLEIYPCDHLQVGGAQHLLGVKNASVFSQFRCINVGTVTGTSALLLRFFGLYVAYLRAIPPDVLKKMSFIPDQVIINSMIRTNVTSDAHLRIRVYEYFQEYNVMSFLTSRPNVTYALGDYQPHYGGLYPLVLHLHDRSPEFSRSVKERCPPLFATIDPYIRSY